MSECNHEGDIKVLDEKVKVANKRIDDLESKTGNLPKIEMLMDMVIETNKEQNEQFKDFSKTLNNINLNLTNLNQGYDNLNQRIGTLETDLQENSQDSKVNLNKLTKEIIFKVIPTVIATIIGAWLLLKFGINSK